MPAIFASETSQASRAFPFLEVTLTESAMQRGWKGQTLLGFACLISFVAANSSHEQFDEELVIKPLRDGRVAATFAFTTLLKGASPRDPHTLDLDDKCNATMPSNKQKH